MTLIKLTHANLNVPVYVVRALVGFWHHSPANKCTHVYVGPNVFPAKESCEEVSSLVSREEGSKEEPSHD